MNLFTAASVAEFCWEGSRDGRWRRRKKSAAGGGIERGLLFSCANEEVCRAMKCELDHAVHWSKNLLLLESNLHSREGRGKDGGYRHKKRYVKIL